MPLAASLFSAGIFASLLLEKRDTEFQFFSRLGGRHPPDRHTAGGKISGHLYSFRGSEPLNTATIH